LDNECAFVGVLAPLLLHRVHAHGVTFFDCRKRRARTLRRGSDARCPLRPADTRRPSICFKSEPGGGCNLRRGQRTCCKLGHEGAHRARGGGKAGRGGEGRRRRRKLGGRAGDNRIRRYLGCQSLQQADQERGQNDVSSRRRFCRRRRFPFCCRRFCRRRRFPFCCRRFCRRRRFPFCCRRRAMKENFAGWGPKDCYFNTDFGF
jgi:hypothetical protein